MSDEQQVTAEEDFNRLWDALQTPIRALEQQVADLSRQTARAEVAGAIEPVSALPAAGKKGRLRYLTATNEPYFDNGTQWRTMASEPPAPALFGFQQKNISGGSRTSNGFVTVARVTHTPQYSSEVYFYNFAHSRTNNAPQLDLYVNSTTALSGGWGYLFRGNQNDEYATLLIGKATGLTVGVPITVDVHMIANAAQPGAWPTQHITFYAMQG